MADSDNSLDILINILTRQLGEQKAQDILKQVKESTASANDENERYQATLEKMRVAQVMENQEAEKGVKWTQSRKAGAADLSGTLDDLKKNVVEGKKAVEDEEEAARHSMSTHAQFKGALKGLATQFPELAHAAHLALNPITLSIAAIVGSVAVWKHRNEELTKSLGGIEMTAFGEDQVSRIERMSAALGKINAAKAGQGLFAKLKTEFEDFIAALDRKEALLQAMGIDTGTRTVEQKIKAGESQIAQTAAAVASLRKSAGTPMSTEKEGVLLAEDRAAADKAKKDRAEAIERIDFIERFKIGSNPISAFKYHMRYGYSMPPDQAIALEQGNVSAADSIMGNFRLHSDQAAARVGRRSALGVADQGDLEIASLRRELESLKAQLDTARVSRNLSNSPHPEGGASDPKFIKDQVDYFILNRAVRKAMLEDMSDLRNQVNNISRR